MPFEFNQHSSLLLIGFLQGIVFAFLLWKRGVDEDQLPDKLMAALLLLSAFHIAQYMLGFAGWYDSHDAFTTFMFYFPFHNFLLIAPIIYFYFRSLSNRQFKFESKHFWHFLPGLIYWAEYLVVFLIDVVFKHWFMGEAFPQHFGTKGTGADFNQGPISSVFSYAGLVSTYIYLWLTLKEYRQYKQYINDNFSDTQLIKFSWLRNILYYLAIGLTISWIISVAGQYLNFSYTQYWTSHFVIAIMIYLVSIFAYSTTNYLPRSLGFEPNMKIVEPIVKESSSNIPDIDKWKKKLANLMQEENPYLDPDLTLNDLAQKVSTNSSVLSKIINSGFGQNFNDYINAHRVAAFEAKLQDPKTQHLTLMSIALDCGFNSKATFNRAFKKFKGISPRDFQATLQNSMS